MLSFEPNIIFIDDKKDQVDGIIQLYQNDGIGVKFYNADLIEGDDKPTKHFSNVNLIYLDLYYKNEFEIDLCLGWIDSLIPKNSFYVLVIWSKDTQHSDEINDALTAINKSPFVTFIETKDDEYKNQDSSFKWDKLKVKISFELESIPEFEEIAIWKKSILYSSNNIIGHLSKNIDADALRKKLQKIIIGHGGTNLLGIDKENEKREVLFDALDSILSSNSKATRPEQIISEANKNSLYNIQSFPNTDVDSTLNSWFHFKLIEPPFKFNLITPGLISYFTNISLQRNYNIQNDETVQKYLKPQNNVAKNKPKIYDVAVILSRPCDVAQNKFGKNIKLLSGILIVNPIRDNKNKFKTGITQPISIKLYDHLSISNNTLNDCTLIFDFRYAFSLPPTIFEERFEKLKIFNKELLSEIQVEYSSYSSRLGITQII